PPGAGRVKGVLAALVALALAAGACTFSRDISISPHVLLKTPVGGRVNSFNLEEQLALGYIPEVIDFFTTSGAKTVESTRSARVRGTALRGAGVSRPAGGRPERAYAQESRLAARAETAWQLSQAGYWMNDFETSESWARRAVEHGRGVPQGWIRFLGSAGSEP